MNRELFKQIPKVDIIIEDTRVAGLFETYDRKIVVKIIGDQLSIIRDEIKSGQLKTLSYDLVIYRVLMAVKSILSDFTAPLINGTGIVLNTGLGRAPLSENAIKKGLAVMEGYSSLEIDILSGKRGRREDKIDTLVALLTGYEAATVVNNNAAAVMICINTLAEGKKVVISRGEQVEIGGSFRMPDIIEKSGGIMVEVGATNKTHIKDYENNIDDETTAIVKVHTSNYKVKGFVEEVELEDISAIAKRKGVLSYYDLGGGIIEDLSNYGLPHEPLVQESFKAGIDLVSFSGDKVLGGPQCGVIAGSRELIERVKSNPLMRAFRLDKIRLALLEESLKGYLRKDKRGVNLTFSLLTMDNSDLRSKGEKLLNTIQSVLPNGWVGDIEQLQDQAGSGTMPTELIDGWGVSIKQNRISPNRLAQLMRTKGEKPIFGFVRDERYILSVRTIFEKDYRVIRDSLKVVIDGLN